MRSVIDQNQISSQLILSALPIPILLIDEDRIIHATNNACEDFFSRSQNKFKGQRIENIIRFKDKHVNGSLFDFTNDLSAQNIDIILPNGATSVDIWVNNIGDAHNLWALMIINRPHRRDYIGEHSEAGEQLAIGAPAILSHEIKNPLAGIKGAAQFLSKNNDPTAKAMTNLIVDEVDRIARLLDQMQNLGNTNTITINEENIHEILDQAVQNIRVANPNFPDIIRYYDPSLPNILVDYDAVLQILINILQNAIDACVHLEEPQITISTRFVLSGALRRSNADKQQTIKLPIEVTIKDNGPGIAKHIQNELFTPFVTTKREGQGLGLAIVRKFVRQLNSRILYERDEENYITIFKLLLPMAPNQEKKNDS